MRAKAAGVRKRIRERTIQAKRTTTSQGRDKGYKVVAVSLYSDQAESLDHATRDLLEAGYRGANRSLVVQAAIEGLQEALRGKSPEEILRYFVEHQIRRPLAAMPSRPKAPRDAGRSASRVQRQESS